MPVIDKFWISSRLLTVLPSLPPPPSPLNVPPNTAGVSFGLKGRLRLRSSIVTRLAKLKWGSIAEGCANWIVVFPLSDYRCENLPDLFEKVAGYTQQSVAAGDTKREEILLNTISSEGKIQMMIHFLNGQNHHLLEGSRSNIVTHTPD
ncbi:hypothetical protein CDAR_68121 [Caerostris darwini]|uniref:Uncharacterized protein n=1 Tax=Caerostris darwini TaxID=1538125 RepID=A0AAV4VRT7_9ARAC|nr:hypothetical protein CDAR_68121 [Caerostris darwini]